MNIKQMVKQAGFEQVMRHRDGSSTVLPTTMFERFRALVLEEAAKVCDERAMKNERACDGLDDEDATSLRSAAWQMSVCAADIRALKGVME